MIHDYALQKKAWPGQFSEASNFTVEDDRTITKLTASFKRNEYLRGLIQSISILQSDSGNEDDILPNIQIRELHTDHWILVEPESILNLTRLSCPLSLAFGMTRHLVDLRLTYSNESVTEGLFQALAKDIIYSNGYKSLKKLVLTVDGKPPFRVTEQFELCMFFQLLSRLELKLSSLGLAGPVSYNIMYDVESMLDFSYLTSFEVQSHGCGDNCCVALSSLLQSFTHLRKLRIGPQYSKQAMIKLLRQGIPKNQLTLLDIASSERGWHSSSELRRVILSTQQKLTKLVIRDWSASVWSSTATSSLLKSRFESYEASSQMMQNTPHVSVFELSEPRTDNRLCERIRNELALITSFLATDVIYQDAGTSLPFLREYVVQGLRIDMHKRGIILNGVVVPLAAKVIVQQV